MDFPIQNAQDLRARIAYLKIKKEEDEIYFDQKYHSIKETLTSPFKFIKKAFGFLKPNIGANPSSSVGSDWVTYLGRVLVPFVLNKTALRGSGFMMKTLVSLLTQKTINAESFNKDIVSTWIDKASSWISSTIEKKKDKKVKAVSYDFGIPPESETY